MGPRRCGARPGALAGAAEESTRRPHVWWTGQTRGAGLFGRLESVHWGNAGRGFPRPATIKVPALVGTASSNLLIFPA